MSIHSVPPALYFRDGDGRHHELSADTPARSIVHPPADFRYIRDVPVEDIDSQPVEVYTSGRWVRGYRVAPPKEHIFTLSVISFNDEREVESAVHGALIGVRKQPETPLPWFKLSREGK